MLNQIQHSGVNFWNEKATQIKFINPEDFRKERLLDILGIHRSQLRNSFGVVNREEIMKRQRLTKFFIKHPKLVKFFRKGFHEVVLPRGGQGFLNHFNPKKKHNPFWQLVGKFVTTISRYELVPPEIKAFISFLTETRSFLEEEERKMADGIAKRASKSTYLEGTIDFSLRISPVESEIYFDQEKKPAEVYGYKLYSYRLSRLKEYGGAPGWLSRKFWRKVGITELVNALLKVYENSRNRILYYPLAIDYLPDYVLKETQLFLEEKVKKILFPSSEKSYDEVTLKVYFQYSAEGLKIRVLNISTRDRSRKEKTDITSFLKRDFPGYSRRAVKRMARKNELFTYQAEQISRDIYSYQLLTAMKKRFPKLFLDSMLKIESPKTDMEFKWYSIEQLYREPAFRETYKRVNHFRNYCGNQMLLLKEIAELSEAFLSKSRKWKMSLCFPTILEDRDHVVSFDSLEPIHLIDEQRLKKREKLDLVSIKSLPSLNGQLVGLTGQNAGGKSTAEEAIVNAIYLAQSGLPVFGSKFTLNIKNKIGMVFLERGSGSTLELLLRKTKKMLEGLNGSRKNGTVLILDEVGTGTQEIDGFAYGKKLLEKLSKSSCSIIFSTQILDLAKYAQDELDAQCFNFDLNHRISPGIGGGGIEKLMAEIGIQELLN